MRSDTAGVGGKFSYDDDEFLRHVPLTPEDVDWLMDKRNSRALHKKALTHFLSRVLATAQELRVVRQNFDVELQRRIDMHARTSSSASNLSPMAAARYLSAEQLSGLFDAFSRQRLQLLEGQRQVAQAAAAQARSVRASAQAALAGSLDALQSGESDRARESLVEALRVLEDLVVLDDPDDTVTGLESL